MPPLPADAFETALADLRISGSVLLHEHYRAPWAITVPDEAELRRLLGAGPECRVLPFHLVLDGAFDLCWHEHGSEHIAANEVVIVTQGAAHVMSRGKPSPPVQFADIYTGRAEAIRSAGPDAGNTTLMCGVFTLMAAPLNPLLAALPPVLKLQTVGVTESPMLVRAAEMLTLEVARAGTTSFTLSRLLEIFCAEAISAYRRGGGADQPGWFKAIDDEKIGRALAGFHRAPGNAWTVEALADTVAMSPSRFATRFRERTGKSVMAYVANWRMNVACRLLRETDDGLAEISSRVGYSDVASFSRAFKSLVGQSPSNWRSGQSVA